MTIYYGMGEIDLKLIVNYFIKKENINNFENQLIAYLIGKNPFEFFSETTIYLPTWINFSILDILYDLNLIPYGEKFEDKSLRDKMYLDFIEYLMFLEVPLKDFLNYTSLFDIEKENRKVYYVLLERFATKYVINELNKYSNFISKIYLYSIFIYLNIYFLILGNFKLSQNSNEKLNQEYKIYKNNFVENLKNIFLQLKQLKSTSFIIKSLSLICFNNFIEMDEIKLSIEFILLSFCEDTKYESKKEDYLEKLFQYILINGLNDNFCEILELPDFIFPIYQKLDYLKKLVNFYLRIKVSINFSTN